MPDLSIRRGSQKVRSLVTPQSSCVRRRSGYAKQRSAVVCTFARARRHSGDWYRSCFHTDIHRVCTNVRTTRRRLVQLSENCEANRDASNRGLGPQASLGYSPYCSACPLDSFIVSCSRIVGLLAPLALGDR